MKANQKLYDLGQSLWIDHITRDLLNSGMLKHYIEELSVTGLTSNPAIFGYTVKNSSAYDAAIRKKLKGNKSGEELFLELALEDLCQAADLFRPIYDQTDGMEGWVSMEVSPRLTQDTDSAVAAVKDLYTRARRPNIFIKIPGTREGLPAVEEAIFAGVPVNVTFLFSREHYLAAAEAYLRGVERRIAAGLKPNVGSVASLFVNCWDVAVTGMVPDALHNQLGIAVARRTYKACRELVRSPRWKRAYNAGARPQRLLWAGTESKDPMASDVFYINALAAPLTVNCMLESTLKAFADHGDFGTSMPADGGDCEAVLNRFAKAGIDIDDLAAQLQDDGTAVFIKSWIEVMSEIASKSAALVQSQW
ncbi:MAG: transaldolase [Desulfobacterales bacterium]